MINLNVTDKAFLRHMKIDPDAAPQDRQHFEAVADAILADGEATVSFEAVMDVCRDRDRELHRAVVAETSLALHKSVIEGLQEENGRQCRYRQQTDLRNERLIDQQRWLVGLLAVSWVAVYTVGSFGNLW